MTVIWIMEYACPIVFFAWLNAALQARLLRRFGGAPLATAIRDELRPFALPMLVGGLVAQHLTWGIDPIDAISFALAFAGWWWLRNDKDDDDRWKRRRKALAAKVAEAGGKLQVVPAGAS